MIQSDASWQKLLMRLEADDSWRSVYVLGAIDAGKTTLCRALGARLAARGPTAAIDCDPGQSALGPPGTVAFAWEPRSAGGGEAVALRFVGSTSPVRHFLQTLSGVKRLADRALEAGARRIVCDSSGYFEAPGGREFHFQMLDLLQPDHLVALQRREELEPLLAIFARRARPRLHRLRVSSAATSRDPAQRRAYRRERFAAYFAAAAPQTLSLAGLGLHGSMPHLADPASWRQRLIALCDRDGFAAAVGILEDLDVARASLQIYSPPFDAGAIASVQFGSIRVDRSGAEL